MKKSSLWQNVPQNITAEITDVLASSPAVRIERIISQGQASAKDFWYDQEDNEWVVLLQGKARLQFESSFVELLPGDYIDIPAHCKHRVDWTDPQKKTIWLTFFYK